MRSALATLALLGACGGMPHDVPGEASVDPDTAVEIDASVDAAIDAAGPPDPFVELQRMGGLCTADEWCWASPTPHGNDYIDIRAVSPDNLWMIGKGRTVLQWNGQVWREHHPLFAAGQEAIQEPWPYAIDGRSANDMWLVFGSTVQHWNGVTWTIVDVASYRIIPYNSIWESPNGDVYTSGAAGFLHSVNGGPFLEVMELHGIGTTNVWGTAPDDVFATAQGLIYHYDGVDWLQVYTSPGGTSSFQGAKNDVWASGGHNTLLHWDGTSWTPVATGLASTAFLHPAAWRATNDVWWYGDRSFVHWDGTQITTTHLDEDACCPGVAGVALVGDRWWFAGIFGEVDTRIGPTAAGPVVAWHNYGYDMWGTADDDMYFANVAELMHWDGVALTEIPIPTSVIRGIAGAGFGGATELFGVGGELRHTPTGNVPVGFATHFDGLTWTTTELLPPGSDGSLSSVHAIAPGEAMIVGGHGTAFYYRNGAWVPIASGVTTDLVSVWGPDADHLWICGKQGTLLRWDRASPTVFTPDTTFPATADDLRQVHGAGGVLWVLHDASTKVSRRTATGAWSLHDTNLSNVGIFAVTANNVVVTTNTSYFVSRWNGTEFVVEKHGSVWPARYLFQPPGGHMWLSNGQGLLRHP